MKSDDEILQMIRQDHALAELLCEIPQFDLTRDNYDDYGEPVRLSSGHGLRCIAGDFSGDGFFLCGERRSIRPVLYATSEGQASIIGHCLAEALAVMIGLPSWRDCLGYSGGGDLATMQSTAEHLQRDELRNRPERAALRFQLAAALSLDLATVPQLLTRLRDAVAGTAPDFVLTSESGQESESLFGPWLPSRNPFWR